nr:hypothetical protein CFP56_02824 [Quercus suber]
MPSLDLHLRHPGEDPCGDTIFPHAKFALESGGKDALQTAADTIVPVLKDFEPPELPPGRVNFRLSFDPVCFEIAEQIPYDSEKMLDLLRLLELVHTSPKLTADSTRVTAATKVGLLATCCVDPIAHNFLGSATRTCEEGDFSRCLNWHAFVSYLFERDLVIDSATPVSFLTEMLENAEPHAGYKQNVKKRETRTMAATQYILRWGRVLLEHLLTTYNPSSPAYDHKSYGWTGRGAQGLEKWHVWRGTLREITAGSWDESERSVSAEAKELFAEVVELMDKIEAEVVPPTE